MHAEPSLQTRNLFRHPIIAHRIFGQAKLEREDGTHFLLGHRRFPRRNSPSLIPWTADSGVALSLQAVTTLKSISTILCKVCRLISEDLLVFVGKIFSHIERHISHSIIYKPGCQYSHPSSVPRIENTFGLWRIREIRLQFRP